MPGSWGRMKGWSLSLLNLSSLCFVICKMGLRITATTQGCCEDLEDSADDSWCHDFPAL